MDLAVSSPARETGLRRAAVAVQPSRLRRVPGCRLGLAPSAPLAALLAARGARPRAAARSPPGLQSAGHLRASLSLRSGVQAAHEPPLLLRLVTPIRASRRAKTLLRKCPAVVGGRASVLSVTGSFASPWARSGACLASVRSLAAEERAGGASPIRILMHRTGSLE